MNNYMDTARTLYRSIPFLTPVLATDLQGNYKCELDSNIIFDRIKFFYVLGGGSLVSLAALTKFSSITVLAGFATPLAIAVGIVAFGVLGFGLDAKLTFRAANNLAIKQYINNDNPPDCTLKWLLADMSRIKLLLKNVDLSEKDLFFKTLMERESKLYERCEGLGFRGLIYRASRVDTELFCLLWNQCNDKDKINVFTELFLIACNNERASCNKSLDVVIDNKMISPEIFTNQRQFNLMYELKRSVKSLKYLERIIDFGFNIRAKNNDGKNIREILIEAITSSTADVKEVERLTQSLESVDKILEKQAMVTAVVLKQGQASDDDSNLTMFPDDILNYIVQTMVATH